MNPYSLQNIPSKLRFPRKGLQLLTKYFLTAFSLPHMTPKEFNLKKVFPIRKKSCGIWFRRKHILFLRCGKVSFQC